MQLACEFGHLYHPFPWALCCENLLGCFRVLENLQCVFLTSSRMLSCSIGTSRIPSQTCSNKYQGLIWHHHVAVLDVVQQNFFVRFGEKIAPKDGFGSQCSQYPTCQSHQAQIPTTYCKTGFLTAILHWNVAILGNVQQNSGELLRETSPERWIHIKAIT